MTINAQKGDRYNSLSVIEYTGKTLKSGRVWRFMCDCGRELECSIGLVRSGQKKSCGLCNASHYQSHNLSNTRAYRIWIGMIARCENKRNKCWKHYGGRGITVCDEWRSFINFWNWAQENGYSDEKSIDRIDNDKGYSPDNCRWADRHTQNHNTRRYGGRIPGVRPQQLHGKTYYRATLQVKGKKVLDKTFSTYEDALDAREQAVSKYL